MADGDQMTDGYIQRTLGALEEGIKRKADTSEVQVELRRAVEYLIGETRREDRLVMDRIDAVRDHLRRDMNGIEQDIEKQSETIKETSEELHKVSGKVDNLNRHLAEISELVNGLASRPATTRGEWIRFAVTVIGILAAIITGNWEAISHIRF